MPADSAFGAGVTPVCPTSRGQTGCGAFRLRRARGQTATGSRAGACRLRRFFGEVGPAVPADSAVGTGVTPVCPTSRGQAGCGTFCLGRVWGQTVTGSRAGACRLRRVGRRCLAPVGQGALRGCVFDAVCPCGAKALLSMARRIMVCRGRKQGFGTFCPLGRAFPARPGGGRKHAVLRSMRPPSSRNHPAGGTAGSARTRSRVQTLENPFLGSGDHLPRRPVPQNAADGKPLLVGLPSSVRTTAPSGTKRSASAPCSWGGCASNPSRRHWPPALPA